MNSPLLQLCAKMMMSGTHTPLFMLQHIEKDARLAHELAQAIGQRNPVTAATLEAYATAKRAGTWDEQNWTAIYESFATEKSVSKTNGHAADATSYRPTCSEDVFKNHADAFAEQDVDKIMLDYTEDTVFSGFDHASGAPFEKRGRAEIREMFSGFWTSVGEWKGFKSVHEYCTNDPAVRSGFLVWAAPGNGILQATDTFVYDENFKIIRQTFVGGQAASKTNGHAADVASKTNGHAADATSYRPTCSEDVFKNHADAFAEQDVDKIMLDYTEDTVFSGFDHASGAPFEKRGRAEIREMFSGFWTSVGEWKGFKSVHEYCTNDPAVRSGFLVWAAPGNGILQATDTFVYDENFKIIRQTFVGGQAK